MTAGNLTNWLHDEDIVKGYKLSFQYSEDLQEKLLQTLAGTEQALFERLMENVATCRESECEMLFCQGLAMGLRLGALSVQG